MNNVRNQQYGASILRIALGTMLLSHSAYLKLVIYGFEGTVGYFTSLGLPPASALAVIATEIVAGLALIVGFHSRMAALVSIPVLLGATWAHWANGWIFSNAGGGWEYPLFLAVAAAAQVFLGDGALAVGSPAPAFLDARNHRVGRGAALSFK
ncbi:MAG TPA: DoxX family protein [Pseudomonadales bacterium]